MSLHMVTPGVFHDVYDRIRTDNDLPRSFQPVELDEAFAAEPADRGRRDLTDRPLLAIDPPGAADLDQALHIELRGSGHRVTYAIADIGAFVTPGGALDAATRDRGVTMYFPDGRIPLHPRILSEDRASLLPGKTRPAVVWSFDLDADGEVTSSRLERAWVRVAEAISYRTAQERIAGDEQMQLLAEVGRRRIQIEQDRGGISLDIPGQRVAGTAGSYVIEYERTLPVETWNAQISIMTGITAAHTMVSAGLGMLRTLPPARSEDLDELRLHARALGIDWPATTSYPELLRSLDNDAPTHIAFKYAALRTLRGAGYAPVSDREPERLTHGAIGDLYAHVTAPLRRLGDRHLNEILLAIHDDRTPPAWAVEAADGWLSGRMVEARARQASIDRQVVDHSEAAIMAPRVGTEFEAVAVRRRGGRVRFQIAEPAIVADLETEDVAAGDLIRVRLGAADPVSGALEFGLVGG